MPDTATATPSAPSGSPASATPAAPAATPKPADPKTPAKNGAKGAETPAPGTTETKAEKFQIKVDGQDHEFTLDELKKLASLSGGAQKRMQQAAEQEKQFKSEKARIDSIMQAFQKGDYEALTQAGLSKQDIEALSIKYLSALHKQELEKARIAQLDPREREILEKQQLIDQKLKEIEAQQKEHSDAAVQREYQRISGNIIDTLQLLPEQYAKNEAMAQLVVDAWTYHEENGLKTTPEAIASALSKNVKALTRSMIDIAKEEEYGDYLSEDTLKKVLKKAQKAAEDTAHPGLTAKPQVREGKKDKQEKPKRHIGWQELKRYGPGGNPDYQDQE